MAMAAYAAKRTAFYVATFFVVSFLIFSYLHTAISATTWRNTVYADFRANSRPNVLVLDPPIPIQYLRWVHDFFTGNWGESWTR